jgi:hypothetical protein
LFGAVFLVNMYRGRFEPHAEFWLSLFSLLAITFILITGSQAYVHKQKMGTAQ